MKLIKLFLRIICCYNVCFGVFSSTFYVLQMKYSSASSRLLFSFYDTRHPIIVFLRKYKTSDMFNSVQKNKKSGNHFPSKIQDIQYLISSKITINRICLISSKKQEIWQPLNISS